MADNAALDRQYDDANPSLQDTLEALQQRLEALERQRAQEQARTQYHDQGVER